MHTNRGEKIVGSPVTEKEGKGRREGRRGGERGRIATDYSV